MGGVVLTHLQMLFQVLCGKSSFQTVLLGTQHENYKNAVFTLHGWDHFRYYDPFPKKTKSWIYNVKY